MDQPVAPAPAKSPLAHRRLAGAHGAAPHGAAGHPGRLRRAAAIRRELARRRAAGEQLLGGHRKCGQPVPCWRKAEGAIERVTAEANPRRTSKSSHRPSSSTVSRLDPRTRRDLLAHRERAGRAARADKPLERLRPLPLNRRRLPPSTSASSACAADAGAFPDAAINRAVDHGAGAKPRYAPASSTAWRNATLAWRKGVVHHRHIGRAGLDMLADAS